MAADVGIYFDSGCTDLVSTFPSYTNPVWRNSQFAGNLGESKDVQLYIKNTGDVNLSNVTITSLDSEGTSEAGWNHLATTQDGLLGAGQSVNVGNLSVGASTSFWLRTSVPAGTYSQTKYDVYLHVTAT